MSQRSTPWCWRSLPLANRTGSDVFARLFRRQHPIAALLESPFPNGSDRPELARYSIAAGAPRQVNGELRLQTPKLGQILSFLETCIQPVENGDDAPDHLPFTGGWLGWLGYDLAWEIDALPRRTYDFLPFPIAFWFEPEEFAVLDHQEQTLWLASSSSEQLDQLEARLAHEEREIVDMPSEPVARRDRLSLISSPSEYEDAVRQAKHHILTGDIFQANLSLRFSVSTATDSWQLYRRLHQLNPSPFASYWHTPWGDVVSCSPERLVQVTGRQVQTRPIAGTRQRGQTPESDRALAAELLNDPKERAEHVMLVDLERNDLGRVCQWGSIEVDELLAIERYSHVMHLVSNVRGQLRPECTPIDAIRALFPGGTITGCPKIRCLEIIEAIEPVRRNLFYGSCGYIDRRGHLDLNILIRTLLVEAEPNEKLHRVWGQVGAGIVADSDPRREWQESLYKARAQLAALQLTDEIPTS